MLGLAQELGIEELWRSCEEHVSATLSPGNACALLTAALEAQERVPGMYLNTYIYIYMKKYRKILLTIANEGFSFIDIMFHRIYVLGTTLQMSSRSIFPSNKI